MINPMMVVATRGHYPELSFRGAAAVVDSMGHIVRRWGNIDAPIFGRSAFKLMQALPLLESGAADAYHLTPQEVALACASHQGEPGHIKILERWLQKLGKDERILDCGSPAQGSLVRTFEPPSVLHNTCSGKHLGFLTTALHHNESLKGYISREHPVQQRVEHTLSEMTGVDLHHLPHGIDGCGISAFAIPLFNIAFAMARFADPSQLHYPRQKSIQRIRDAIIKNPDMLAGSGGFDTKVIRLTKGDILCKTGVGSVVGIIPSLRLGIAVKIDDGCTRAVELAFLAILRSLGCLEEDLYEQLGSRVPVLTQRGKTAGFFHPTPFTTFLPEVDRQ